MTTDPGFSHWNYRVVRRDFDDPDISPEYTIVEVYYDLDGHPVVTGQATVTAEGKTGHTFDMFITLGKMVDCLARPVLRWSEEDGRFVDVPGTGTDGPEEEIARDEGQPDGGVTTVRVSPEAVQAAIREAEGGAG